ncbi:MAG: HAD-IA family hydrolase [Acidobacteria bacterium]|uniref:HAD-IA family hydrolase n=1 Tax=Candidatus Polarisedimenticola svalbardensis TaxID=2886004 RepID=A0A8J7CBQ5_9BACT|nr:HAD-IA family hydrolase [Candidatus Polarisedimenticola svalbardensis]
MSSVKGVVFDLDGTLVDSYTAITDSLNHARAGWDMPALPESEVRLQVGRGLEALIADLVGPGRVEEGVIRFRERYAEVYASGTRILDGVAETLEQLSRGGYRMAVASNKPARFTGPILEHFGLALLFDAVEGPDTAGATKPDPEMIRRCLRAMDVTNDEAIYVGDMVLDVESGQAADVGVVLVAGGSSSVENLCDTGRPVLDSIRQLPKLLPLCGTASAQPEVT